MISADFTSRRGDVSPTVARQRPEPPPRRNAPEPPSRNLQAHSDRLVLLTSQTYCV